MKIRPATTADIPALMAVEKHAITAAHWSLEQYQAVFSRAEPARNALILEDESGIQGFLIARVVEKEWEIENIVIAGLARRRGLGTRLLSNFLDGARSEGADAVLLEVRESNVAARGLYKKCAFLESGRRKLYYRDPQEDAVTYRLDLT